MKLQARPTQDAPVTFNPSDLILPNQSPNIHHPSGLEPLTNPYIDIVDPSTFDPTIPPALPTVQPDHVPIDQGIAPVGTQPFTPIDPGCSPSDNLFINTPSAHPNHHHHNPHVAFFGHDGPFNPLPKPAHFNDESLPGKFPPGAALDELASLSLQR